ncbi:hypothetical protein [Deinococcus multiflagellatus]|uniref:Uncharacterized protein n=1 Tax=Deinococcus multiflagellatus TaxID=1656887 RepID=A0ABW1ZSM5_9DEIO|nr:hypothetical protein [Deinococcus multiflagellatus]MBZ9715827.1 hypothetical protein [Deinococcus multiflagellatus]
MTRRPPQAARQAEERRLQARHVNLTQEVRALFGRDAYSVVLYRGYRLDQLVIRESFHVYGRDGRPLEPVLAPSGSRLLDLLQDLMDLHGVGHWLLDDTLLTRAQPGQMPESRPFDTFAVGAGRFAPALPDVPWS